MLLCFRLKLNKMEKIFVIQNAISKEYFWTFHASSGWTTELNEANKYESEDKCVTDMIDTDYSENFDGNMIEIKTYYNFGEA
jgi:hypothetical protein